MKTLFCIAGETASGKDSLSNKLIKEYPHLFRAVCSYATRPKRDNEEDGKEHYFVSQEYFNNLKMELEKNNSLVAYTKITSKDNPNGYEYMASADELEKANIYIIDPAGIKYLKENFSDRVGRIVVIYITAHLDDRIKRAKERSDFNTAFKNRVMNEFEQFLDFNLKKEYDYIIHNDDYTFDKSYDMLKHIVNVYKKLV